MLIGWVKKIINSLIVGQTTNIGNKFIDEKVWDLSLPCIILSNKLSTFMYFYNSPEYSNDFGKDYNVEIGYYCNLYIMKIYILNDLANIIINI